MHTTNQLLDAVAAARGGATDYRLAKILETSTSNITAYRKGRSRLSLEFAHRVAALLQWDPAYVVACVEYERAQRVAAEGRDPLEETGEILATWERIAQHFKPKHVAGVLLALLAAAGGLEVEPAQASTADPLRVVSVDPCIDYAQFDYQG